MLESQQREIAEAVDHAMLGGEDNAESELQRYHEAMKAIEETETSPHDKEVSKIKMERSGNQEPQNSVIITGEVREAVLAELELNRRRDLESKGAAALPGANNTQSQCCTIS